MKETLSVNGAHAVLNSLKKRLAPKFDPLFVIWSSTLIMLIGLAVSSVYFLRKIEAEQLAEVKTTLTNLTRVNEEHALRTFRAADQTLQFILSRYAAEGSKLDLRAMIEQGVIDAELFALVGVIDAQGIFLLSNGLVPKGLDLSDREHFAVHRSATTPFLFISKPVLGRASGKRSINLTRRINNADGSFGGVVVVTIYVSYFTRFYDELQLPPNSVSALTGVDGVIRARTVNDSESSGEDVSKSPFFGLIAEGKPSGTYNNVSPVDGIERLTAYKKVSGFPLVVTNGIDTKTLASMTQSSRRPLFWQTGSLMLLLLATAAVVSRQIVQTQQKNEQLDVIFALSPDAFVSFDQKFRVKYCNPAFERLTGLPPKKVIGLTEGEFVMAVSALCLSTSQFGGLAALRNTADLSGNEKRPLIQLALPTKRILQAQLKANGSISTSQILYLRDVTHETLVEDMKTEFLATAAHELRTPMACILGFAEVMLAQKLDESQRQEFTGIILKQSQQMEVILNDLLDLARIEARGGKDFVFVPLDLQALVKGIVAGFAVPLGRLGPEVNLPITFCTVDVGKSTQAILNVLSNAFKYSDPGAPVKIFGAAPVAGKNGTLAGICIQDQGPGIKKEHLARVFERFYRADTSGKTPGTGLGMSIVKEIMEIHGGEVLVDSVVGLGTVVTLLFPIANVVGPALPAVDVVAG